MSDVRTVFTTAEVAESLDVSASYVLRLTKKAGLTASEFRSAGKRNYLFNQAAVEKLKRCREAEPRR